MIIKNHYFLFLIIEEYFIMLLQRYNIHNMKYILVFELRYDLFIIYKGPEETLQIYHCVL